VGRYDDDRFANPGRGTSGICLRDDGAHPRVQRPTVGFPGGFSIRQRRSHPDPSDVADVAGAIVPDVRPDR
jgi:hypothetical protein